MAREIWTRQWGVWLSGVFWEGLVKKDTKSFQSLPLCSHMDYPQKKKKKETPQQLEMKTVLMRPLDLHHKQVLETFISIICVFF